MEINVEREVHRGTYYTTFRVAITDDERVEETIERLDETTGERIPEVVQIKPLVRPKDARDVCVLRFYLGDQVGFEIPWPEGMTATEAVRAWLAERQGERG